MPPNSQKDGVQHTCVARLATSAFLNAFPPRINASLGENVAIADLPAIALAISPMHGSNTCALTKATILDASNFSFFTFALAYASMFSLVVFTPFGRPVVPEVQHTYAVAAAVLVLFFAEDDENKFKSSIAFLTNASLAPT